MIYELISELVNGGPSCTKCGATMVSVWQEEKIHHYRCLSCGSSTDCSNQFILQTDALESLRGKEVAEHGEGLSSKP